MHAFRRGPQGAALRRGDLQPPISPRLRSGSTSLFPQATELPNGGGFVPTFEMTSSEGRSGGGGVKELRKK